MKAKRKPRVWLGWIAGSDREEAHPHVYDTRNDVLRWRPGDPAKPIRVEIREVLK